MSSYKMKFPIQFQRVIKQDDSLDLQHGMISSYVNIEENRLQLVW